MRLITGWKNISIAKKLYSVIGIMAFLILAELGVVLISMRTLSAVRAFVAGEGMWSKAQKDAAAALQRYFITSDEIDYRAFLYHLTVCEGDHKARIALSLPTPDLKMAHEGFVQGRNHPDDIDAMIFLINRFGSVHYIHEALNAWAAADSLLKQLEDAGRNYHAILTSRRASVEEVNEAVAAIRTLNMRVTEEEDRFSRVLGEGSRWLERLVISLLSLVVLMVESIGLTLAFLTSRSISRGLHEISVTADALGQGDFSRRAEVVGEDEIGHLSMSINKMGQLLQKSYRELEMRVHERTAELAHAVQARDSFLSIASHELKTPLTSLNLQTQLRRRLLKKNDPSMYTQDFFEKMIASDEQQMKRLVRLVDDILDISRLKSNKLYLQKEKTDLTVLAKNVLDRFVLNFQAADCLLEVNLQPPVLGSFDISRIEQVLENLLTNAMKYGAGKPIFVKVWSEGDFAKVSVRDQGIGIAHEDQSRIFMQFERAVKDYALSGLGLGLYIANEIVRMHHGVVEVQSEIGKGAMFIVSLPVTEVDTPDRPPNEPSDDRGPTAG